MDLDLFFPFFQQKHQFFVQVIELIAIGSKLVFAGDSFSAGSVVKFFLSSIAPVVAYD